MAGTKLFRNLLSWWRQSRPVPERPWTLRCITCGFEDVIEGAMAHYNETGHFFRTTSSPSDK